MAVQDYSNASALLRNTAPRRVVDPSSRPTDFMRLLQSRGCFVPVASLGGAEPYVWSLVKSNGSTAARFTEGQAAPAGGRRSFSNPSVNAFYWWEVVRVSGRARDVAAANGYVDSNLITSEIENGTLNLMYAIEQDLLGSTVNLGIVSIIDNADLYGGVDPASITVHASLVTPTVGALDAAALADHWEAMGSPPYSTKPTDILSAQNQVTNYLGIAGLSGGTQVTRLAMGQAQGYDISINPESASYQGVPWRAISNATSTEIYMPNLNDYKVAIQRDVMFEPYGKLNDDQAGQVSFGAMVIAENRRLHSKMEGVTA